MAIRRIVGTVTILTMAGLVYPKDPKGIGKAKPPHTHVEDYPYRHLGESGQVTTTTSTGNVTQTVTPQPAIVHITVPAPTVFLRRS